MSMLRPHVYVFLFRMVRKPVCPTIPKAAGDRFSTDTRVRELPNQHFPNTPSLFLKSLWSFTRTPNCGSSVALREKPWALCFFPLGDVTSDVTCVAWPASEANSPSHLETCVEQMGAKRRTMEFTSRAALILPARKQRGAKRHQAEAASEAEPCIFPNGDTHGAKRRAKRNQLAKRFAFLSTWRQKESFSRHHEISRVSLSSSGCISFLLPLCKASLLLRRFTRC